MNYQDVVSDEVPVHGETSAGGGDQPNCLWSVDRYVKAPALSPDGRLLACVVVEQERYPLAIQIPLDAKGDPVSGQEREVVLPIEGAVRRVLYSPCLLYTSPSPRDRG